MIFEQQDQKIFSRNFFSEKNLGEQNLGKNFFEKKQDKVYNGPRDILFKEN